VEPNTNNVNGSDLPDMQTIEERLNGAFVAPRVVDQQAFEDLSSTLRGLMKDAVSQGRMLMGATGDIKNLDEQARQTGRQLQNTLETAARLLPMLDQRMTKAEQISTIMNRDIAARLETLKSTVVDQDALTLSVRELAQKTIDSVTNDRMTAFSQSIERMINERVTAANEACEEAIRTAQTRLGVLLARTDGCIARLAGLQRETDDKMTEVSGMLERIQQARAGLEHSAATVTATLSNGIKDVHERVSDTTAKCDRLMETTREQLIAMTEHSNAFETHIGEARQLRDSFADLCNATAKGQDILAQLRETTAGGEQLRIEYCEVADRIGDLLTEANLVGPRLASLVQRGDLVGRGLDAMLNGGDRKAA
jgi:hypothetical protein